MVARIQQRPWHATVLVLCVVGVWIHQWVHWDFLIDDAGICFAYARNVAAGEGVVPWPGGERIEAFSNPTWMLLLVLAELVGIPSILVAKPLAMALGAVLVLLVYRVAELAIGEGDGVEPNAVLVAPLAVALSPQLAIWSASGLENSLWCVLLAGAIAATVTDARSGRYATSALLWLGVAWTRPEGLAYAMCGAFWYLVATIRRGGSVRSFVGWMAVLWLPTYLLELARIWYFAWPMPNTWYAKIEARANFPLRWNERGWGQVAEYCQRLWQGWYLPVYVLGLLGTSGRGAQLALAVIAIGGCALLYPAPAPFVALGFWPALPDAPQAWLVARIVGIVATTLALPFAAVGGRGWEARALCWHTAGISVLFSVYANGDWMGGFRWMSLMVPSVAVLFAAGTEGITTWFERAVTGRTRWGTAGWTLAALGVCALIPPSFFQSRNHLLFNSDETVPRIRLRAAYTKSIVDRTFFEGPVVNVEMDQGGYLFDRPDFHQLDMAGLVDIPMSRHTYLQRPFIEEWIYNEHTPTFAHVHGWWAQFSGLKTYPGWDAMVALPPHPDLPPAPPWHEGMWVNRALFTAPAWTGTDRVVPFEDGLVLDGWDVPAALWAQGGHGYFEIGFSSEPRDRGTEPQVIAFLTDGTRVLVSWDLPIGYGILRADQWGDDVVMGRYALRVPGDVPLGRYDLGLVAIAYDGHVLAVDGPLPPGAEIGGQAVPAMFAQGELRFSRAIKVAAPTDVDHLASSIRDEVLVLADGRDCDGAERRWIDAKRVRPDSTSWLEGQGKVTGRAIADCWALTAEAEPDRAPELLARAEVRDPASPELARVRAPVAQRLWTEGKAARAAGDWQTAYDTFTALLAIEPWRSWARRYAEEARDERLGIQGDRRRVGVPSKPPRLRPEDDLEDADVDGPGAVDGPGEP